MQVPTGIFLNTINCVPFVHDQVIIRIGVTPDMIGTDDFRIADGRNLRRGLLWPHRELAGSGTCGQKQQWNEIIHFHGLVLVWVGSSVSVVTGIAVPPREASATSMVWRT